MYSSKYDKKPFSKVERNSQLLELVNVMVLNANLPNNLWGQTLLTAYNIHNRVLSKKLNVSSYKA
jgi:hypothetical protein